MNNNFDTIDDDCDEFNVIEQYKQTQDDIEAREQEFIQHLRSLSILSNDQIKTRKNSIDITNGQSSPRNKSVLIIDEFLDLRKLRRQFVTSLYNHIKDDFTKLKTCHNNIKALRRNLSEHDTERDNHLQNLLKSLDVKEKELIRLKHHQDKITNKIKIEIQEEYSQKLEESRIKFQNDIQNLMTTYESKLKSLATKLQSFDSQSQKESRKRDMQENERLFEEKEKLYLSKLQQLVLFMIELCYMVL